MGPPTAATEPIKAIIPTHTSAGIMGYERAKTAREVLHASFLDNPLPIDDRIGYLCAAWEGRYMDASSVHATGASLVGQGSELVDVADVWQMWLNDPDHRAVLRCTIALGRREPITAEMLHASQAALGPRLGAWQDVVAYAAWTEALHRSGVMSTHAHSDARMDAWLGKLVIARQALPAAWNLHPQSGEQAK